MTLARLDRQLLEVRLGTESPNLSEQAWAHLATTIHGEVGALDEATTNRLRASLLIPPERYVEELTAFQAWMDLAHANASNAVLVRAQVMTELYVAFVWLRDSVMRTTAEVIPANSVFATVERFLSSDRRRLLRNAVAHGRWCYLAGFDGLEFWSEPAPGQPHQRFEISQVDLGAWQLLSRGAAIAVLLALTERAADDGL